MAEVILEIKGLKEVVGFYNKGLLLPTYTPDINVAILSLHNTIEKRVKDSFYAPGELSSVLVRESLNPFSKSNTSLQYGLVYNKVSIPLEEYPYSEKELNLLYPQKGNAIPYTKGGDKVYYLPINKARSVTVKVNKRGSLAKTSRVRTKYKKFLAKDKNTGGIRGIFVRKQEDTWKTFPSMEDGELVGGERAPIRRLYGYPLSTLADIVYEHDPYVQAAAEKVTDRLVEAIGRYYDNS